VGAIFSCGISRVEMKIIFVFVFSRQFFLLFAKKLAKSYENHENSRENFGENKIFAKTFAKRKILVKTFAKKFCETKVFANEKSVFVSTLGIS
jgi:hypothetical protein